MIIYIYGADTYRSREFLRKSVNEFKAKRDPQGYNTLVFDAEKGENGRILGEMMTLPFLAEKRLIVLNNLLSSKDKDFLEKIIELVQGGRLPETNIVTVWQGDALGKVGEVKKLHELLKKGKYVYEFEQLKETELTDWILKNAKERSAGIDRLAALTLARQAGPDMWLVNSVLDQLVSYKNGKEILSADVQLFLEEKIDDNIFNLVDAVVAGNKKLAFKLLSDQRASGEDDAFIFSMLMRQFKILLQIRDLWDREDNLTSDAIAKQLGLHPYVAKKSLPLVRRFPMNDLKRVYDELLNVDIGIKTGLARPDMLVDFFVGKV